MSTTPSNDVRVYWQVFGHLLAILKLEAELKLLVIVLLH